MSRKRLTAFVATAMLAAAAHPRVARAGGFDGQRYVPAAGAAGGFVVERTLVPQHLDWGIGLFMNYAVDPVVVVDEQSGDEVARPLESALTMNLLGSIGLFD